MRFARYTGRSVLFFIFCHFTLSGFSQLGIPITIKKPKEYEERVLRSEKSTDKPIGFPQKQIQNMVTHYNFYYNATNRLNEILDRAKSSFIDDFSKLIPFYNYTLEATQMDSVQLDSITYKASTGIALHDLRGDWVDNLYLIWGAAYYLQKDFDSAYLMFQFINFAFAPKEKDGYPKVIGSSRDGSSAQSIATVEKGGIHRKVFSEPPSRNDAFIWQIRNFLAQDQLAEAASLIVALRNDPTFPDRLDNDLHEVEAYWFYKQKMWDSSAHHLVKALSNATNQQEKARWEYLAAQMFEISGDFKQAENYYEKVSQHTTDPIMDIYARLYAIRVNKDGGERTIEKNVADLLKMAKRDKYVDYQDIIYYMAAQMQLEGNNPDAAMELLEKSAKAPSSNASHRNKTFLQLAEMAFDRKEYRRAYNYYDSVKLDDPMLEDPDKITARKTLLGALATNVEVYDRQDSLQRIAAMPEEERRAFVNDMVKKLRKERGLKDIPGATQINLPNDPTMFPTSDPKGEWYFYNTSFRSRGLVQFKSNWGNRPNVDNWRRSSTLIGQMQNNPGMGNNVTATSPTQTFDDPISFDALWANIPLTPERLQISKDSMENAMFEVGKQLIQDVEDCPTGTRIFEDFRLKFPESAKMDRVLLNLYYCYNKHGEKAKAEAIRRLMNDKYQGSVATQIVVTGKNPLSEKNPDATAAYERIYDLFIEGKFEQAIAAKKDADTRYGKNYWTPQLLYIEAVYYIRNREDSTAKMVLNNLISTYPTTPLGDKAANLLTVLNRRAEIEEELRNLNVTRNTDTTTTKPVVVTTQPKRDTVTTQPPVVTNPPPRRDTVVTKPVVPKIVSPYTYSPNDPHYVVLILNKVDPVFSNEAKNAFNRYNRETFYNKTYTLDLFQLDADNRLLMIAPFANAQEAIAYVDRTKPKTATEIIPWLKGGKYTYTIMTDANFDKLKANLDIENYKSFLNEYLPGKF